MNSIELEWKVLAVKHNDDPDVFAKELQEALTDFSSNGFVVDSQMARGSALVITGHKLPATPPAPALPPGISFPPRMMVPPAHAKSVTLPVGQVAVSEEFLYNYIDGKTLHQKFFPSIQEATMAILKDIQQEGEGPVPVSLTIVISQRFAQEALLPLVKAFADDLFDQKRAD